MRSYRVPDAQPEQSSAFTNVYTRCCACWGTMCTPDVVHVVSVITDVYTRCCACWGLNARLTMCDVCARCAHVVSVFTNVYTRCCAGWGINARLTMCVPDALMLDARCTTRSKFRFLQMCTPDVVHTTVEPGLTDPPERYFWNPITSRIPA
jgi:hypothetical protein